MIRKQVWLQFEGGPFHGQQREYMGNLPNGPRTQSVSNASRRLGMLGFYERQGEGPDESGLVKMVWQSKVF